MNAGADSRNDHATADPSAGVAALPRPAATAPIVSAALSEYSHDPRGPRVGPDGTVIDLAEEYHEASKIAADFPGASLGRPGAT